MKEFLLLICGIFVIACIAFCVYAHKKAKKSSSRIISVALVFVSILVFFIVPIGFYQVETGEAVVLKHFGKASGRVDAGLHWRFWISDSIDRYDLKTQEVKQEFEAYSQDAQPMKAELTIQFRARPENLIDINEKFGNLNILKERITSVANERARVVLSRSSAMLIIENRSSLSSEVQEEIVNAIKDYYVDVTMVVLEDVAFNDAFENAVEQKMIAEQQKLQAQYDKETAIIKAEQELEVAKRLAEAELEKAKASAQAQIEIANAEAEKIKIKSLEVARMLGFTITENGEIDMSGHSAEEIKLISDYLKYIEYLSVWDGKLPDVVGGDTSTVYIPNPTN